MKLETHRVNGKAVRPIAWLFLYLFLFTLMVMFSWNSFAPDLFQVPAIKMKQALGLVLFASCISFLIHPGRYQVFRQQRSLQDGASHK